MKKLFSTSYSETAFNIAMLVLRVGMGVLMVPYGYQKLIHFAERKDRFMNFMGIGSTTSLILVIFAEVICASLLVLGLLSRFAAIVLVILTSVIVFKASNGDVFGDGQKPTLFLLGYFALLLVGPGKYSVDGAMGK